MEIVYEKNGLVPWGMGKVPKRAYRRIHLAAWMELTGHDQGEVAAAGGVKQPYIANLIAGRKPNPSAHVLMGISELMGISVNDLYRKPPSGAELAALEGLSPAARARVFVPPKRKS